MVIGLNPSLDGPESSQGRNLGSALPDTAQLSECVGISGKQQEAATDPDQQLGVQRRQFRDIRRTRRIPSSMSFQSRE